MTVVLNYSAGSVRAVPIAFEPPERERAARVAAERFATWRAALAWCERESITVCNEAAARAAAVETLL